MLESLKKNEKFEYQRLSPEEMASKGILGRLVGPCADFMNPTRNGRKYGEDLWEKVFDDPIMKEKIANGVCFGELGHPADRTETDMEKIAVCLREQPKKNDQGQLVACFDILDTPNGRILKTLCDYGTTIGVSSRGTGDVIEDENGDEIVDPDTYECECWDVVLVPAVESARMQYVTEGLDIGKAKLKRALSESLEKATESDRKIMSETLRSLDIKLDEGAKPEDVAKPEEASYDERESDAEMRGDKKTGTQEEAPKDDDDGKEEAEDDGSKELIASLTEALKAKSELEAKVQSLQEQLAVANDKVDAVNEELGACKESLAAIDEAKGKERESSEEAERLRESLEARDRTIDALKSRIRGLVESKRVSVEGAKSLNESIRKKDLEIKSMGESLDEIKSGYESRIASLTESVAKLKEDSEAKAKEQAEALERERKAKDGYRRISNSVVNRYIESRATTLGVKPEEIKNRLPESYTVDDIDSACEELQSYALNISKLPFSVDRKVKVRVHESKNGPIGGRADSDADDVDESLYRLAGM